MEHLIHSRLLPASRNSGLRLPGQYVWCGSVVQAEGKWHLFASAWPARENPEQFDPVERLQNYWRLSTIVRAEADHPEGPYTLRETVMTGQGGEHWAYETAHGPCLVRAAGRWVLYFQTKGRDQYDRRIGYATADSVYGPWNLADKPLNLGANVTNPSAWVEQDGSVRLAFRTPGLKIAVAAADSYDAEYRIVNADIFPGIPLEDPFLCKLGSEYHMIVEDNEGRLTGSVRHGAHLVSRDGVSFEPYAPEPRAYTHTVMWREGDETTFERRERPWLIIQEGRATHLVTGVLLGSEARSLVQPLRPV